MSADRDRGSHRRGHRPAAAAHPQPVRERRHRSRRARRRAASTCSPGTSSGAGDHEIFEPQPGRQSLVARIEGTDPDAPSLLLMGHTDVVPVNPDGWSRDPFGAEIVDGFVWGRGAVDMLNLTASQAVAFRRLADSGFRPKGTLIYLAVADEEALGRVGRRLAARPRARRGVRRLRAHRVGRVPDPDARRRRGSRCWSARRAPSGRRSRVHGTPGHGSQPFRTDNALVTAAEVVRRIADVPARRPRSTSRGASSSRGCTRARDHRGAARAPTSFAGALAELPLGHRAALARVHAHHVRAHGRARRHQDQRDPRPGRARGRHPHAARVRRATTRPRCCATRSATSPTRSRSSRTTIPPTTSPIDTPLWDSLARVERRAVRGVGAGAVAHGGRHRQPVLPARRRGRLRLRAVLAAPRRTRTSPRCSTATTRRVDQESLALSTQLWEAVARDLRRLSSRPHEPASDQAVPAG